MQAQNELIKIKKQGDNNENDICKIIPSLQSLTITEVEMPSTPTPSQTLPAVSNPDAKPVPQASQEAKAEERPREIVKPIKNYEQLALALKEGIINGSTIRMEFIFHEEKKKNGEKIKEIKSKSRSLKQQKDLISEW